MAEAGVTPESDMKMMAGHDVDNVETNETVNTESSRDSKKRRVSTKEEASTEFLGSDTGEGHAAPNNMTSVEFSTAQSAVAESSSLIDGLGDADTAGKVGGGTVQCGAAAGQASMSESTAHSEVSVDDAHASADGVGALDSGTSVGDVSASATYKSVISDMAIANRSNPIKAENYYILHWLCRIRNVSCLRGLRISFLQPDFLWSIYGPMMRSRKLWRTDGDIRVAADLWCADLWCVDRAAAEERYGHISDWDVSSVTNMSELFRGHSFDEPMQGRYRGKDLFNDDISRWDVSNVTDMGWMFGGARSFNQPIGDWDVSKVTDMSCMFYHANAFNQPVADWDVSKVKDMTSMFGSAYSFNQPIGDWDVSKVTDMTCMFYNAHSFNRDLTRWDMRDVSVTTLMFASAHVMHRDNKPAAVRDHVYECCDDDDDDDSDTGEWEETEAGVC